MNLSGRARSPLRADGCNHDFLYAKDGGQQSSAHGCNGALPAQLRRVDALPDQPVMEPIGIQSWGRTSHEPGLDETKIKGSESQSLPTRGQKIRCYCANAARKALRCPVHSQVRLSPLPR
jgi:hypothetical protein